MTFPELVGDELYKARRKHRTAFHNLHEAYAVMLEEVEEFWSEVKKQNDERDKQALRDELVQIAAMCQRAAEDLGLME